MSTFNRFNERLGDVARSQFWNDCINCGKSAEIRTEEAPLDFCTPIAHDHPETRVQYSFSVQSIMGATQNRHGDRDLFIDSRIEPEL